MPAIVTDDGLPYFVHLTTDCKWLRFDPPYSEGPAEYKISLNIASDGLYTKSYFYLKVINNPPFNDGIIYNLKLTATFSYYYYLSKNYDPEGNIVNCTFLNISSPMVSYYSYNPISQMFLFFPSKDIFSGYPKTQ